MIPIELEVENFLAYRDPGPLRFDGIHVACLAGPNGAGKSSLLDAITWSLWGRARSNSADELMHQGQQNMRVALTFDQGPDRFRVQRQRKAGKQGASALVLQAWDSGTNSWRDQSGARIADTQKKIETLLRLDFETFVNSAFLMQGRADEFTTKTPTQRKQVLGNILGLSRWEVYETRAKERIAATREEIHRTEGALLEIEHELSQREAITLELQAATEAALAATENLRAAESQWAGLEQGRLELAAITGKIDDLGGRIQARERELAEAERDRQAAAARADKASLLAGLDAIQSSLQDMLPMQAEFEAVIRDLTAGAAEAARLRGINQALIPQTEPLKTRVATLETALEPVCPTCGQALSEAHRARLLDELHRELEQRREEYRLNQAHIKAMEAEAGVREGDRLALESRLKERPALERRAAELQASLAHADEAARQADSAAAKIQRWGAELAADRKQRSDLEAEAQRLRARQAKAGLTVEAVDRLRLEKRLADERVGGARQRLSTLDARAQERQRKLEDRQGLTGDLGLYDALREACSKRGVPAMIIETAVPELERSANELLGQMTDGRMHVRIETQKEIKTGELREALDILISDELGTRPYELYSGGEAFRVNFALRIALSRLLARRAGARLRSLFIDEGFGTQDARGREQLVAAINTIQDDFDRILVITHIDELKDAFPARIEVTKTPQGSQFRLA